MRKSILIVIAAALVVGCRSVDFTSQHSGAPPKCEVHGAQMQPEWISVSSGEMVCLISKGYLDAMEKRFPHHGGWLLSGERQFRGRFERRVRDFVCLDCTHAFEAHWKTAAVPCRVIEVVYHDGWKTYAVSSVDAGGQYSFTQFDLSRVPHQSQKQSGRLPGAVFESLTRSSQTFPVVDGVRTYEFARNNFRARHPAGVLAFQQFLWETYRAKR